MALVIAGDAIYNVLTTIKREYGDEFKWLIYYPGDWHMLGNFQKAIMKPYFDAGLRVSKNSWVSNNCNTGL